MPAGGLRPPSFVRLRLVAAVALHLGVHANIGAPLLQQFLAGGEILAAHRRLRRLLELRGPVAEAVAVPRRLGLERRQPELLPDLSRALHVLALWQRDRREVLFQRGVDQHRAVLAVVALASRPMPLVA